MGSGRGRESYGVVGRRVATAVDAVAGLIADLDEDDLDGEGDGEELWDDDDQALFDRWGDDDA